jgi:hypothetical protein
MSIRRKFWVRYLPKFDQIESTFTDTGYKPNGYRWKELDVDKCCDVVADTKTTVTNTIEFGDDADCVCTFILNAFENPIGEGVELTNPFTLQEAVDALNTEYEGYATFEAVGTTDIKVVFNIGGAEDLELTSDCECV